MGCKTCMSVSYGVGMISTGEILDGCVGMFRLNWSDALARRMLVQVRPQAISGSLQFIYLWLISETPSAESFPGSYPIPLNHTIPDYRGSPIKVVMIIPLVRSTMNNACVCAVRESSLMVIPDSDGSCKNSRGIRSLMLASSLAMVKVVVGMVGIGSG